VTDDATPFSRPLPDLVGGRYQIVSRLGVGGMGVVYKAIDTQLNRAVAVKALEDRRLLLPGSSAKLRTEALAAASLDHPYICKIYELVETRGETFIVMEFVEGETLASMLKRGAIPLLQTLLFGREIAEGLAEAHVHGLVHRDVKPSNVMVTPSGHVKLLDFGVAGADVSSAPADQTRTVTPQITVHAGTPQYMSPEQAAGQPVTARADLFSLGVVLYECLAGALPFSGTTTFDYVRNVMQASPRRLDRIAPETPADLVDLVERCLEKVPADRPESADVVVAELRRLAAALTSPEASVRTARQARSGRRWKAVAALALALAAVAVGWRIFWPRASTDAPLRQSRSFVTSAAQESGSRISPDGQWVSFIATSGGASQVMVQRVDGGEARPITLGPGTPVSQIWSPDGTQLACVLRLGDAWTLQIYPAFFGGAPQQSLAIGAGLNQVKALRWIDRAIFLQVSDPKAALSLRRLDLDGAADAVNISASWKLEGGLRSVDVRPDGRAVVMVLSADNQSDLWTANIDGSSARALTNDAYFERDPLWNGRGDRILFQSNRGGQIDLWEIDPRSASATQLTFGDMEEIAESTSADGSLISFQLLSQDANLWLWGGADHSGQQLTQDALSDYSPVVAATGRMLAFQRSQPTPSLGYTLVDARLFVAPFDGRAIAGAVSFGDGFNAAFSSDGEWIAYLKLGDVSPHSTLQVRNLTSSATVTVSDTAWMPVSSIYPVDWSGNTFTWRKAGPELLFVDRPAESEPSAIRRFIPGGKAAGPPLARSQSPVEFLRDLYVAPDNRRLAYLSAASKTINLHVLDLESGASQVVARWDGPFTGVFGRGWVADGFVAVRRVTLHDDMTADIEVFVASGASGAAPRKAGTITKAFMSTSRLDAARRVLYVTRMENGVHNIHEFSLATGALKALTRNTLAGVTFSGFHPVGSERLVGTREERRQDIWLIQESGAKRPGNPAGR
jgi:serine/threonine protein kinase